MKYRILIADDEEKIIRLIKKIGHWDELGVEIIETCSDGQEAMAQIEKLRPDIVLTDIRMPIIDGIQMIELAKQKEIDSNFIVISGYKQFEYARNAVSLGVVDYLLKPLSETKLNLTLEKTCRMIDEKRKREVGMQELEKFQMHEEIENRKKMYENLLQESFLWNQIVTDEKICNNKYKTDFYFGGKYRCALLTTNIVNLIIDKQTLFNEKVEKIIKDVLAEKCKWIVYEYMTGLLLLMEYAERDSQKMKLVLSELFYAIKDLSEIYGEFTLNIGLSTEKKCVSEIQVAAKEAVIAEWGRFVTFGDRVLEYGEFINTGRFAVSDILDIETETELKECVKSLDSVSAGRIFKKIDENSARYAHRHPADLWIFVRYMMKTVLEIHIHDNVEDEVTKQMNMICTGAKRLSQIIHDFYLFVYEWLEDKQNQINNRNIQPILCAKNYIDTHYYEPISLDELAAKYSFSANYFGRIFQEAVGMGFSDYLINTRIEKAKEMLLSTNDSVKTIAENVGYPDSKYFYKLFKKRVGIKPVDYRKLYG